MGRFYNNKIGDIVRINGPDISIDVLVLETFGTKRNRSATVEIRMENDNSKFVDLIESPYLVKIHPEVSIGILPYPRRIGRHCGRGVTLFYNAPRRFKFELDGR